MATAPQAPPPVIPDAGVYGAQTAAATDAYNNAIAQAAAQRNSLYHSYGLTNQGAVDPNNPGGAYQMMLHDQGNQFQADRQDAASRGLGDSGLGAQAENADRSNAVGQDFQFQSEVANAGSDYQNAIQDALSNKQGAISQAYQDALNTALQNQIAAITGGDYTAPGTGTNPGAAPATGQKQSHHAQHQAQQHHNRNHQGRRPRRGGGHMRAG